ncbi:peptidylprolyl isomerase [Candidatus Pelagibacter sp. HIMB1611]|uniref:peptidylprolyl isomerase n=1 Tax=unclassified Candidatus Pelagibacter TaxID=2647897 RepID=UPI003F8639B8
MFFRIIFYFLFFILLQIKFSNASIENKILFKVNDQIITTQDISNEIQYLAIINKNFLTLEKNQIFEISKNSLIKRKIKQIELSKRFPDIEINKDYLNKSLENTYLKLGFSNLEEFKNFLKEKKFNIKIFEENLITNSLWNEFISFKYKDKIKIDKNKILLELKSKQSNVKYSYLLSEIVFSSSNEEIDSLIKEINNSIIFNGFENTALKYSISNSANLGGKIGWVQKNALSELILKKIKNLKEGEHTQPINIPSGFLILKINKIKKENAEIDVNQELNKLINQKQNDQYNTFSNIYFSKIKKEYQIDEL